MKSKFARFGNYLITVTSNPNLCQNYLDNIFYMNCKQHVIPHTQVFMTRNFCILWTIFSKNNNFDIFRMSYYICFSLLIPSHYLFHIYFLFAAGRIIQETFGKLVMSTGSQVKTMNKSFWIALTLHPIKHPEILSTSSIKLFVSADHDLNFSWVYPSLHFL